MRLLILLPLLFSAFSSLSAQQTEGLASFYADRFHNKPTSTGEKHDKNGFMAASMEYPYGTILEVTNPVNGKTVEVRVNDCGPHHPDRILDLSRAAAKKIGLVKAGVGMVKLRVVGVSELGPTCKRGAWSRDLKARGLPVPNKNTHPVRRVSGEAAVPTVATVSPRVPTTPTVGEPQVARIGTPVPGPNPTVPGAKGGNLEPSTYANYPVPATSPTTTPTPATKPVSVPSEPATKAPAFAADEILFGVQVGAFGKAENAERLKQQLADAGFDNVWAAKVGTVYRVFTGKFYFPNQAEGRKAEVRKAGYKDATVRRVQ